MALVLLLCQVRVTVTDSGPCVCVMSFRLLVDSSPLVIVDNFLFCSESDGRLFSFAILQGLAGKV